MAPKIRAHGDPFKYTFEGCRCDECREAIRAYWAARGRKLSEENAANRRNTMRLVREGTVDINVYVDLGYSPQKIARLRKQIFGAQTGTNKDGTE